MKSLSLGIIYLTLMCALMACGKNNKSGRTAVADPYLFGNPYGTGLLNINSPYSYGGTSVNQVIQENPCQGGFSSFPGYANQSYAGQRMPIQVPLTNFPTVIPPNDVYVGVTSYGDVAVLVGQQVGAPPLFVGYMCPRSFAPNGQGQVMGIKVGSYSRCLFKPITASTVVFPGGSTAEFRWLDGGSSVRRPFTFCL